MDKPFERLARELTPGARRLLLMDSAELERETSRTRAFIDEFRIPNPLRLLHARQHESKLIAPPGETRLRPEDLEAAHQLHFTQIGTYESRSTRFERWVGPDGFTILEANSNRRFFVVIFEDDRRISMWPDVNDETRAIFPTTEFLTNTESLWEDYRRMLEGSARYIAEASARPLYRYGDPNLDLELLSFYHRHQVALPFVMKSGSIDIFAKVSELVPDDDTPPPPETVTELLATMQTSLASAEHVDAKCRGCASTVRVPLDEVTSSPRCESCAQPTPPASAVLIVDDHTVFDRLLHLIDVPIVVTLWDRTRFSSLLGLSMAHDALLRADGRFAVIAIENSTLRAIARRYGADEFPTYIRVVDGEVTHRLVGKKPIPRLISFATQP